MGYYGILNFETNMIEFSEISNDELNSRSLYEKQKNTYSSVPVYDSIKDIIIKMKSYCHTIKLPDKSFIIPSIAYIDLLNNTEEDRN